jgi:hypothetical protein
MHIQGGFEQLVKGSFQMRQQPATSGKAKLKSEARRGTARRVLQQLFEIDLAAIDESGSLADYEGCDLRDVAEPLSRMGWRIRVKDRIFSCFGVDCEIDEPLSTLLARIELAESGVRCTLAH